MYSSEYQEDFTCADKMGRRADLERGYKPNMSNVQVQIQRRISRRFG